MQKWEYHRFWTDGFIIKTPDSKGDFQELKQWRYKIDLYLNHLGENGWELVLGPHERYAYYTFKRPRP